MPPRIGTHADWPAPIAPEVVDAVRAAGIKRPWAHQAQAVELALRGESVVIATGTASGKSLAYLVPVLSALVRGTPLDGPADEARGGTGGATAGDIGEAAQNENGKAAREAGGDGWAAGAEGAAGAEEGSGERGDGVDGATDATPGGGPDKPEGGPGNGTEHAGRRRLGPRRSRNAEGATPDDGRARHADAQGEGHSQYGERSQYEAPSQSGGHGQHEDVHRRADGPTRGDGPSRTDGHRRGDGRDGGLGRDGGPDERGAEDANELADRSAITGRPPTRTDTSRWPSTGTGAGGGRAPGGATARVRAARSSRTAATATWRAGGRGPTALYLSPTKALAADQRRTVADLAAPLGTRVRPAVYDGDTAVEEREWARQHANYLLTNPDMLHLGILPSHSRWSSFLRGLRYVVIDECHSYRGVFGSHVAQVIRRLRRVCARYGSSPSFLLASATAADPAVAASRLTGVPVTEVTEDHSPRGELVFALWEPPLTELRGERNAPVRRTATAESADLLTDLATQGVRTVCFVRSRRGAELISLISKERLAEVDRSLPGKVAAYRGGYLPEERRALERALHSGELLGLAATTALELGMDVAGLDAVVLTGYPGTLASLWQQAGRAGRTGQGALAVLVARDDPLDTYLVHHPDALFHRPVESTVLDPDNPYVLAPHLCAAAAELPLTEADLELFGAATTALLPQLEARRLLRRRSSGWHWTRRDRAADLTDIRGAGGEPVQVVEEDTGRLLGTVDASAAHTTVHEGAVHLHRGRTYLVRQLDLDESVAFVEEAEPPYSTTARDTTSITVLETTTEVPWGDARLCLGSVEVTNQVVSFLRRKLVTGEILGESRLDLPPRTLRTRAVWWTVTEDQLDAARVAPEALGSALHAAEHASIGMLPLFATCDRLDIGGVSVPLHPDTLLPTVFVYDGHPGGAGFAERAFHTAARWLTATREAIASCTCESGCPSCIQSPKCGNGNDPLDKHAAVRLLGTLLSGAPDEAGEVAPDGASQSVDPGVAGQAVGPGKAGPQ